MEKIIINWIVGIFGLFVLISTLIEGYHSLFLQSIWIGIAICWVISEGQNTQTKGE